MYDRARHLEWFWRLNVKSTICNHSNMWQDPKYEKQFVKRYQIFKQTKTWQIGLQSFPLACQLIQFSANKALCYLLSYCLSLKHLKISIFSGRPKFPVENVSCKLLSLDKIEEKNIYLIKNTYLNSSFNSCIRSGWNWQTHGILLLQVRSFQVPWLPYLR